MKDDVPSHEEFGSLRKKAEGYPKGQCPQSARKGGADLLETVHALEMQNDELRRTRLFLENSRDDYFRLYEFAPVSFLTVNAKGIVTKANIGAAELLNVDHHLLQDKGFLAFVAPEDRGRFCQLQKKVAEGNGRVSGELILQVRGRSPVPARVEMLALNNEGKGHPQYLMALIDISQQKKSEESHEAFIRERTRDLEQMNHFLREVIESNKRTEKRLRESENKFRTVADYTYDWEFWLGPDKKWVYSSPSCERISGYVRAEFISDPGLFLSIIHPEDHDRVRQHIERNFFSERVEIFDFRIITKAGELRWLEHCCQAVYDDGGQFLGRRASNRDITERKRMEDRLRESEKRFRLALDATSDGLWDRNLVSGEVHYGENWYKLLGYGKKDVRQGKLTWETLLHPDDAEQARSAVQNYIDGKSSRLREEFRLRNKKGEWQWILSRGKVVEWEKNGRPLRLVGTHTDITVRKNMELALRKQQGELKEKVRQRTAELEEINIALNVLLRKRDRDRDEFEANIAENVSRLIVPYLDKLQESALDSHQQGLVVFLRESIRQLTSPFMRNIGESVISLSPMELQVASMVKEGKSSKEIAALLRISSGTVNIHRRNIRKKMGITNEKANLQLALQAYMKD